MQPEELVYSETGNEGLSRDNKAGLKIGLLEMFMLASADEAIGTIGSGFNFVAASFGGYASFNTQEATVTDKTRASLLARGRQAHRV
jgi:hypothetical protein